jgi:hypothetical protein
MSKIIHIFKVEKLKPGLVAYSYNPSTQEADIERS